MTVSSSLHHGQRDAEQPAAVLARAAEPELVAPAVGRAQVVAYRAQERELVGVAALGRMLGGELVPGRRRPGVGEPFRQVTAEDGADDVAAEQVLAGAGDVLAEVLDALVRLSGVGGWLAGLRLPRLGRGGGGAPAGHGDRRGGERVAVVVGGAAVQPGLDLGEHVLRIGGLGDGREGSAGFGLAAVHEDLPGAGRRGGGVAHRGSFQR